MESQSYSLKTTCIKSLLEVGSWFVRLTLTAFLVKGFGGTFINIILQIISPQESLRGEGTAQFEWNGAFA